MNNLTIFKRSELERFILSPLSIEQQLRAIEIRDAIAHQADMPKYLLAIEVDKLLQYVTDNDTLMLIETLWNTGGRINEILPLQVKDIIIGASTNFVRFTTLKKKTAGITRLVPLTDNKFVENLKRYIKTKKLKASDKLFNITDRTANRWIYHVVKNANDNNVTFSIGISTKTFRHSYAIHLLYQGISPMQLHKLLGHTSYESTQVYLNILALESMQDRIKFLF